MKATTLYTLIAGFTLGVAVCSLMDVSLPVIGFVGVVATSLIAFSFLVRERGIPFILFGCFLVAFSFGLLRFHLAVPQDPVLVEKESTLTAQGEGVVLREPQARDNETRLVIGEILVNDIALNDSKILLHAPQYAAVRYGDRVSFEGTLHVPKNFINESGIEFDYASYLAVDGIYYEVDRADVEVVAEGEGSIVRSTLYAIKNYFLKNLGSVVPEPESSLAAGLIVGSRQSLGSEIQEEMRIAGLIHIVVLSGYNLTLVAKSLIAIMRPLPGHFGTIGGVIGIALFTLLAGGGAATVRAALMAMLIVLADRLGRRFDVIRGLILAATAMVIFNPMVLLFDPSFHLSFLAMLGLIYFSPLLEKRLLFVTERWSLREIAAATLGTQIFVTPYLIMTSGAVSLLSVPANLLVLPLVPTAMLLGALSGLIGILALPFGYVVTFLLSYILFVTHVIAAIPFAAVPVALPQIVIIVVYALLFFFIWKRKKSLDQEDERFVEELSVLSGNALPSRSS